MGVPAVEKAPAGLGARWHPVWRAVLAHMKAAGTWSAVQRPLVDEYVIALRTAVEHRERAQVEPFAHSRETDRDFAHPGFASADREVKRAVSLASTLGLTVRAQREIVKLSREIADGNDDGKSRSHPLAALDELQQRRARRSA
jgi:phage terminase small subunit